jgi:hypothetical protein
MIKGKLGVDQKIWDQTKQIEQLVWKQTKMKILDYIKAKVGHQELVNKASRFYTSKIREHRKLNKIKPMQNNPTMVIWDDWGV